jgi:hypothetical protein
MKPIYILSTLLILTTSCGESQTLQEQKALTGDIETDVNNLLPPGKTTVDVMDGIMQTKRQEELTIKFQEAIKKNYDWFIDYSQNKPAGQPMAYHPNTGLTEKEFEELMIYMLNIEFVSTGKKEMEITNISNIIEFQTGDEKLKLLESVQIDLSRNIVYLGEYELSFSDSINATEDTNALKSKWKGYSWKYEELGNLNINALKNIERMNVKKYEFRIGRLEKNDKTFLSIKGLEIENGVKKVEFDLPIIF